jgi:TonB-dependent receptor
MGNTIKCCEANTTSDFWFYGGNKMNSNSRRRCLPLSTLIGAHKSARAAVSALALGTFSLTTTTALAQTTEQLEEVIVTGIRGQLQSSQIRKQEAEEIVDSITAVEIGALPDRSVTEVLQRIPGLAIGRVPEPRDADRIAVEGAGVTVRGLTWVRSELNGRSAFSAKNSRTLGFEDVPPELMAAVDVFKNPSAERIEGGLSGTVDLRTRLPFDSNDRTLAFSGEYTVGDLAEEWSPAASALYSDRWSTGIGELGFLVSVSTSELTSNTHTLHIDKYHERTNLPGYEGQTVFAPGGMGWRELTIDRERVGASAAVQWRPSDTVDVSLQYFYSDATFEQDENAAWNTPGASLSGSDLIVEDGYLVGGQINDGGFHGSSRYNERNSSNQDIGLHFAWTPSDSWQFDADVQRALADSDVMDLTMGPEVGPGFQTTGPYALTLNGSNDPRITIPANNLLTDPSMYFHGWAMDHHEDNEADAWAYRADGEYTFDNSDWLDRIRFGVRHEDYDSITRETGFRWGSISQNWAGGPAVFTQPGIQPIYRQQNFGDWFHGGQAPSPYLYQDTGLFRNYQTFADTVTGIANADGVTSGCCDWTQWDGDYSGTNPAADGLGINPQNQKTWAGYVAMYFEHGAFDGNLGARVVETDSSGTARLTFSGVDSPFLPAEDQAFANGASIEQTDENSYTDVLPSLNLRYKVRDDVFLRFAVAKSLTRPNFPLLLPGITVSVDEGRVVNGVCTEKAEGDTVPGDCIFRYSGQAGNAQLEPMRSWQYDVTAEWYMTPTNSLTGALFYKDLSGFMETTPELVPYTNNGVTRDVRVLRPVNQGDGLVRGIEVAYNGFFDFLPGFMKNFGARSAFTYVESSGARNIAQNPYDANQQTNSRLDGYPLEGLSKTSYNAELYYSTERFEARLAYNWRERYLLTMAAANLNVPAWADDFGQLDGSVQFNLTPQVKVGIQGVNLADSTYKVLVDNLNDAGLTYHNWVSSDRRFSVFVRASL